MEQLTQGYGLVEGPVWEEGKGLLFSDVLFGGVFRLNLNGAVETVFEHRRGIGGMALHEADGLIVSGRNLSFKPFSGDATVTVLKQDESAGVVGFNDLTTDEAGRIYAGALGASPVFDDGREPRAGNLYLVDLDGSARVVAEDVQLTNGLGFSPGGATLYHSDSRRQTVFCYSVAADGALGAKRPFAKTGHGAPDGLAVSEDGAVWVALAGGYGVGVYSPSGTQQGLIEIPHSTCTSLCFGGPDRRDLYIASGSEGGQSERSGAVFRTRTDVAGLPVAAARTALGETA